jgi:hypothetical protein
VACVSAAWTGIWVPLVIVDGIPSLATLVLVVVLIFVVPVSLAGFLLYHGWLDKRAGRQSSRGLPPGGGGEAPWRLAPADPAGQPPPVGRDLRQAAEAAQIRRPRPALPRWPPPHRWRHLGHWYAIGYPGRDPAAPPRGWAAMRLRHRMRVPAADLAI